jgi:hypothetical protein
MLLEAVKRSSRSSEKGMPPNLQYIPLGMPLHMPTFMREKDLPNFGGRSFKKWRIPMLPLAFIAAVL